MALSNSLNIQIWANDAAKLLFEERMILRPFINDQKYVMASGVILGDESLHTVVGGKWVDGVSGPTFTAGRLAADVRSYAIDEYVFKPFYIDSKDDVEFAFPMYQDAIAARMKYFNQLGTQVALHEWAVTNAGSVVRTTGTTTRLNKFGNTVKTMRVEDIMDQTVKFGNWKIQDEKYLFVTHALYRDIRNFNDIRSLNMFQPTYDAVINAEVLKYDSWNIVPTTLLPSFTSALVKKALPIYVDGGAGDIVPVDANTDLECGIFVATGFARYAIDAPFITATPGGMYKSRQPLIQGWVRIGASPARVVNSSNEVVGIVTIIEGV